MQGNVEPTFDRSALSLQMAGLAGVLGAGVFLALTSLRLPLICPLRAMTGIPCPFCGMTTGTVATLRGDLGAAFRANLFSPLVVPAGLAGLWDRWRALRLRLPPRRWPAGLRKAAPWAFGAILGISWIFQLFRFNVL